MSLDALPLFDASRLPTVFATEADHARTQAIVGSDTRTISGRTRRATFIDFRKREVARRTLERLPEADETLHVIMPATFDLHHLLERVVDLAGEPVDSLRILTLGFGDGAIETLCRLSDAARVQSIGIIASHYFKSVDTDLWSRSHRELTSRGHRLYSGRVHAKAQLYHFRSGRGLTLLTSANLRSCKSLEFASLTRDSDTLAGFTSIFDALVMEAERCASAAK